MDNFKREINHAIILVMVMMCGCSLLKGESSSNVEPTPSPKPIYDLSATAIPSPTSTPILITPQPTEAVVPKSTSDPAVAVSKLSECETDVITFILSENELCYDISGMKIQSVADHVKAVSPGFGILSKANYDGRLEDAGVLFQRLSLIDRDVLSYYDQFLYDNLYHYMDSCVSLYSYGYQIDPLDLPYGNMDFIPRFFETFKINSIEDAERYLYYLNDAGRYYSDLLSYEKERAENGYFMTPGRLENVLNICDLLLSTDKNHYLEDSFNEKVDDVKGIHSSDKKRLKAVNKETLYDVYLENLRSFRNGMEDLSECCCVEDGASYFGSGELHYYSDVSAFLSGSDLRPDEMLKSLERAMDDLYSTMKSLYELSTSVTSEELKINNESPKKIVSRLKSIYEDVYSKKQKDIVEIHKISKQSASLFPYCMILKYGNGEYGLIVNDSKSGRDDYLKIALKTYPGTVSVNEDIFRVEHSSAVDLIASESYDKGISALRLQQLLVRQDSLKMDTSVFLFSNMMLTEYVIPSIISIYVNCYAYSEEQVTEFMKQFELCTFDKSPEEYYYSAIDEPFETFTVSLGYSQFSSLLLDISSIQGAGYDEETVMDKIRTYGPGYIGLISERIMETALDSIAE